MTPLAPHTGRLAAAVAGLLLVLGLGARLWAGECVDGEEVYLEDLRAVVRGAASSSRHYGALCLAQLYGGGNRWAGPRAAKRFARRRSAAIRRPVARICRAALDRGKYWPAQICLRVLASFGVKRVGKHDVFALQKRYVRYGLSPILLAVLDDKRATAQLIRSFGRERHCYEYAAGDGDKLTRSCRSYKARSRNRWIRKEYDEQKISVLNALWHLADPSSRPFLETVSRTDPSKLVRDRARRVLQVLPKPAAAQ